MSYEFFIAQRYLKSKRKTGFISLNTYISIIGVMVGVAALIIVLSVMNGFESEVRSRIVGFRSHLELRDANDDGLQNYSPLTRKIQRMKNIVGASPFVSDKALIVFKSQKQGVEIKGVDSATINSVSEIPQKINYGVFDISDIGEEGARKYPGMVLGSYLADRLGVDLGDKVSVVSPAGLSPMLSRIPITTFKISGFFETGIADFDDVFAYVALEKAQKMFQMRGKVSGLEIKLDDISNAESVASTLEMFLGDDYKAVTWFDMHKNLFSAMQLEKWGMFIALSLIITVAAFNIISTLIMVVLEKTKEISILKSMGATSRAITRIFVFEGLIGGVVGTFLGCGVGFLVCWLQIKYKLISLPSDVYIISAVPVLMQGRDFIFVAVVAILLCYLAAIYPAKRASALDPIEAMRYE